MIRKKKKFTRPRKMFEAERIKEENELKKKYGLKNKTEIWKALEKVNYYRRRAMALAKSTFEEQEILFNKLRALGLNVRNTTDVLGLKIEDLLDRRLSTIIAVKGLANTPRHGRQMVVHKNVMINGKVISSPSYLVPIGEENSITVKSKDKKQKEKTPTEEVTESAKNNIGETAKKSAEDNNIGEQNKEIDKNSKEFEE